ncbi:MAG: adenosylcobinamide-GDP ribazoletransferase [Oligoflexus sp.]
MFNALAASIAYFTRVPLPKKLQLGEMDFVRGTRFFPWIGLLVGLLQVAVIGSLQNIVPYQIAVFLSVVFIIWLTGALHEDGLADCADAFGGGHGDRQRILNIMKDSRLGTYGVLALLVIFVWRIQSINLIPWEQALVVLSFVQTLSRYLALTIAWSLPYARAQEKSTNSKSFINYSHASGLVASLSLFLFLILLPPLFLLPSLLGMMFLFFLLRNFFYRHLQGFTGDCLGASQQIAEAILYTIWMIIYV